MTLIARGTQPGPTATWRRNYTQIAGFLLGDLHHTRRPLHRVSQPLLVTTPGYSLAFGCQEVRRTQSRLLHDTHQRTSKHRSVHLFRLMVIPASSVRSSTAIDGHLILISHFFDRPPWTWRQSHEFDRAPRLVPSIEFGTSERYVERHNLHCQCLESHTVDL